MDWNKIQSLLNQMACRKTHESAMQHIGRPSWNDVTSVCCCILFAGGFRLSMWALRADMPAAMSELLNELERLLNGVALLKAMTLQMTHQRCQDYLLCFLKYASLKAAMETDSRHLRLNAGNIYPDTWSHCFLRWTTQRSCLFRCFQPE